MGENSLGHRRRDEYPAIFYRGQGDEGTQYFIDESGDFGDHVILPSYYLVTLVFQYRSYFYSFEHILVYYDNGQRDLGAILNAVFSSHFSIKVSASNSAINSSRLHFDER